jgi:chemotaxis protein CheD
MLPDSGIAPEEYLPFKFADTAVPALKKVVRKLGAYDSRLTAKIVGGANMFANLRTTLNIGVQNIEAARQHLTTNNIGLIAEDVGGNRGRRVAFNVVTGLVTVRTIDGEIKKI